MRPTIIKTYYDPVFLYVIITDVNWTPLIKPGIWAVYPILESTGSEAKGPAGPAKKSKELLNCGSQLWIQVFLGL